MSKTSIAPTKTSIISGARRIRWSRTMLQKALTLIEKYMANRNVIYTRALPEVRAS